MAKWTQAQLTDRRRVVAEWAQRQAEDAQRQAEDAKRVMAEAVAHSERFGKVATYYARQVALAYERDIGRAMADSDEQVAATVAAWERSRGLAVRDWRRIGREECEGEGVMTTESKPESAEVQTMLKDQPGITNLTTWQFVLTPADLSSPWLADYGLTIRVTTGKATDGTKRCEIGWHSRPIRDWGGGLPKGDRKM